MNIVKNAVALALVGALCCAVAPSAQAAAPQKPATKQAQKGQPESLETIQAKLDVVGKKLVNDAARNVTPNAKAKAVAPEDKEFVARYVEVDETSMTTEVRPATGGGGQYIGVIKYLENQYECRGKSKDEALKAPCAVVKSRRMNELIRYDGKWSF